ncbi:MAG: terminase small subunit, partial [Bacilli bacterium]
KAAELLGKRYRLFTDKIEADVSQTVIFTGEDELED